MLQRVSRTLLWIVFGLMMSAASLAASPYSQVTLPVADRSSTEFQQAVIVGYGEIMKRLSGNPAVMTTPALQNSVTDAASYVTQYSYSERVDRSSQQRQLLLQLTFNEHALTKILQNSGQSILGKQRPPTLVVMLNEQNGVLNFFSAGDAQTVGASITAAAQQRGLPIVLPLGDLDDQAILTANTVPSITSEASDAMRTRYQVTNLLVGVVVPLGDRVQVQWQLWSGDRYYQWTVGGADLTAVLPSSFDRLLETIADQFAVVKNQKLRGELMVEVTGVYGLQDYVGVVHNFKQLTPVSRVTVREMTPNSLLLSLEVNGGEEALQRALQSDKSVIPVMQTDGLDSATELRFDWRGAAVPVPSAQTDMDNA